VFSEFEIENFQSWEYLKFSFKDGITLIKGTNLDDSNKEGVGKSAIPNALCWILTGQLPKDVKAEEVVREGSKSCAGKLVLEDGSFIFRSRGPNDLFLMKNGEGEPTRGIDVKNTQLLINDYTGLNYDLFVQSIYFAQNDTNKFITANESDKGKIFAQMKNLSIFDRAAKKGQEYVKEYTKKFEDCMRELERNKHEKSVCDKQVEDYLKIQSKIKEEIQGKQTEIKERISKIDDELKINMNLNVHNALVQIHNDRKRLKEDIEILTSQLLEEKVKVAGRLADQQNLGTKQRQSQVLNTQFAEINARIQKTQDAGINCPTCGGKLDDSHKAELEAETSKLMITRTRITQAIGDIAYEIKDLTEKLQSKPEDIINDINNALKNAKVELESIEKEQLRLTTLKPRQDSLNDERQRLVTEIGRVFQGSLDIEKSIEEARQRSSSLAGKINGMNLCCGEIQADLNRYTHLKDYFKQTKQYVFQSSLDELNDRSNKYLRELFEVPVRIEFNNVSEDGEISKINVSVNLNGATRSLGMLSGGQFRRVCLAVDLSLSDMIANRNRNPINVIIFDEYMKDLSLESMIKVQKLLQARKGCIVLIEHSDLFKEMVSEQFEIIYQNGVSRQA
jgi:DNA repair exonuclease SbcCD ATPase subunit